MASARLFRGAERVRGGKRPVHHVISGPECLRHGRIIVGQGEGAMDLASQDVGSAFVKVAEPGTTTEFTGMKAKARKA